MLVVAGKNEIAVRCVQHLLKYYDHDVKILVNKTDDGLDGWQPSLQKFGLRNGLKLITLDEAYENASIFISLEFDQIVDVTKFKTAELFNIHFSMLPAYKGMYTSVWPILNGDNSSGVTLHNLDPGIDTGKIIDQVSFKIPKKSRSRDLYHKYSTNAYYLFKNNLDNILTGNYKTKPQTHLFSTYFSKKSMDFKNLKIDLNSTAHTIERQIYAYSFRAYQLPIIYSQKIVEVQIQATQSTKKPGAVLKQTSEFIEISTIDFDIKLFIDKVENLAQFANCKTEDVPKLLQNLAGIHDQNENGWSPIIIAAYNGNTDVVRFLLESEALVNDQNYNGTSVLMYAKDYALRTGDKSVFDLLLMHGADVAHMDFSGKSVVDYITKSEANFLGLH